MSVIVRTLRFFDTNTAVSVPFVYYTMGVTREGVVGVAEVEV